MKTKAAVQFTLDGPLELVDLEVPDPYYGDGRGFELVFEMVERACPKILERLKTMLQP